MMEFDGIRHRLGGAASAAALLVVLSSCGGSSPSPGGSSPAPSPVPGAVTVSGTERLAWSQPGDRSGLQFVAYVNDRPVALAGAVCDAAIPEAQCSAPLPPLTDGVHTIALAAQSGISGLESERSNAITVQKVSGRSVVSAASFPDARPAGAARLEATVTTSDGLSFAVDVIARGLHAPVQLAWIPDGRLLIAEAEGQVQVVRPAEPDRRGIALDTRALLQPQPAGPVGIAAHPDFARNQFVYLSYIAQDEHGQHRVHLFRLREAGDTLGEPAAIFEAPVAAVPRWPALNRHDPDTGQVQAPAADGPRLAFGPDGLLYLSLPPGVEFDHEPAASRPRASMLRLDDSGRAPDVGPLDGITAHPLGFAWHPSTREMWTIVPDEGEVEALAGPVTSDSAARRDAAGRQVRLTAGEGPSAGALVFTEAGPVTLGWARTFAARPGEVSLGTVRLAAPIVLDHLLTGMSARIGDVVAADGGVLFLATSSQTSPRSADRAGAEVVLRLSPRPR